MIWPCWKCHRVRKKPKSAQHETPEVITFRSCGHYKGRTGQMHIYKLQELNRLGRDNSDSIVPPGGPVT